LSVVVAHMFLPFCLSLCFVLKLPGVEAVSPKPADKVEIQA